MRAEKICGNTSTMIVIDDPHAPDPVEQAELAKWFREWMPARIEPLPTEAERLFSLDKPSLQGLSYILRHRELWPKGFVWDYGDCQTCAMGLAAQLWALHHYSFVEVDWLRKQMPGVAVDVIFRGACGEDGYGHPVAAPWVKAAGGWKFVTPEMVADQIDKYLAEVR